jgi:phospholipid-transporting ATPase
MFERDVSPDRINAYPQLYHEVRNGLYWNWQKHITMVFSSIWHSLLIFGAIYFTNYEGTADIQGLNTGFWVQSYLFSTPLLMTVLIKSALGTTHWVWLTFFMIFISWFFNLIVMFFVDVLTPNILYSDEGTALINHVLPTYYILCILSPLLAAVPDIISS